MDSKIGGGGGREDREKGGYAFVTQDGSIIVSSLAGSPITCVLSRALLDMKFLTIFHWKERRRGKALQAAVS